MNRVVRGVSGIVVASVVLAACASPESGRSVTPSAPVTSSAPVVSSAPKPSAPVTSASAIQSASRPASPRTSVTPSESSSAASDDLVLAFAGDSNAFEGGGVSTTKGLGEAGKVLAAADIASVNLETALADDPTGLKPQPKLYHFLTDSKFPEMLAREGVDVVSMANNHAMDYGVAGMKQTLAIKERLATTLPIFGIGNTVDEALAPVVMKAKGRTVMFLGGTDVLESTMDWYPQGGQPGVSMVRTAARFNRLVATVKSLRAANPDAVIVVWMHWGADYVVCTEWQRQDARAKRLADAGASIIVGSHAHRVQRIDTIGQTLVAYGLGNFNFDSDRVATHETGVLTVRVPRHGALTYEWAPGTIVDGRPTLFTGAQKDKAIQRLKTLPGGC